MEDQAMGLGRQLSNSCGALEFVIDWAPRLTNSVSCFVSLLHSGDMAFKNSHNIKAIDETMYNLMSKASPICTVGISKCNSGNGAFNTFACQAAFEGCNLALTAPYRLSGLSPYNMKEKCGLNPLCSDFSAMEKFMNQDSTKKALHVDGHNPNWKVSGLHSLSSFARSRLLLGADHSDRFYNKDMQHGDQHELPR